jgi:hypothetical protein
MVKTDDSEVALLGNAPLGGGVKVDPHLCNVYGERRRSFLSLGTLLNFL